MTQEPAVAAHHLTRIQQVRSLGRRERYPSRMPKPTLLREQNRSKNSQMSRESAAKRLLPQSRATATGQFGRLLVQNGAELVDFWWTILDKKPEVMFLTYHFRFWMSIWVSKVPKRSPFLATLGCNASQVRSFVRRSCISLRRFVERKPTCHHVCHVCQKIDR